MVVSHVALVPVFEINRPNMIAMLTPALFTQILYYLIQRYTDSVIKINGSVFNLFHSRHQLYMCRFHTCCIFELNIMILNQGFSSKDYIVLVDLERRGGWSRQPPPPPHSHLFSLCHLFSPAPFSPAALIDLIY